MSHRALKKWIHSYCEYKGLIYRDGTFNNQRYFIISENEQSAKENSKNDILPF
jgi:hypothetical protein